MAMKVIIVGGGKVGTSLALLLLGKGYAVKVIEAAREKISRLQQDVVLEAAGILGVDVVAATTGQDETNLVVTNLARFAFNVARVVARVNNPKNAWMFTPMMGVDVAVNQADLMASLIAKESVTE